MRVHLLSKRPYINKNVDNALHGKSLIFTDGRKKIDLESVILDLLTNYKFNAMSIEHPKNKKLQLEFLDKLDLTSNIVVIKVLKIIVW